MALLVNRCGAGLDNSVSATGGADFDRRRLNSLRAQEGGPAPDEAPVPVGWGKINLPPLAITSVADGKREESCEVEKI